MILNPKQVEAIIQALRCADAELQGIGDRYNLFVATEHADVKAANETREELSEVHQMLTGEPLIP